MYQDFKSLKLSQLACSSDPNLAKFSSGQPKIQKDFKSLKISNLACSCSPNLAKFAFAGDGKH